MGHHHDSSYPLPLPLWSCDPGGCGEADHIPSYTTFLHSFCDIFMPDPDPLDLLDPLLDDNDGGADRDGLAGNLISQIMATTSAAATTTLPIPNEETSIAPVVSSAAATTVAPTTAPSTSHSHSLCSEN